MPDSLARIIYYYDRFFYIFLNKKTKKKSHTVDCERTEKNLRSQSKITTNMKTQKKKKKNQITEQIE